MAEYIVNPGNAQAVITASAPADTILLEPGTYPTRLVVANKAGLRLDALVAPTPIIPSNFSATQAHPALATRGVIINGGITYDNSPDVTTRNLWLKFTRWFDTTLGQSWTSIGLADDEENLALCLAGSHRLIFDGVEFSWGYGPTQTPFDPTTKYPEMQSGTFGSSPRNTLGHNDPQQAWWINKDEPDFGVGSFSATPNAIKGRANNPLANGARAIQQKVTNLQPPQILRCHFHDLTRAMVGSIGAGAGPLVIDQTIAERIYQDAYAINTPDAPSARPPIHYTRSITTDAFAQGEDSGNPHGDNPFQHYGANNVTTERLGNWLFERNFSLNRGRGAVQAYFNQGNAPTPTGTIIYDDPYFRDNAMLGGFESNGVLFGGVRDGLFERNMLSQIPGVANPSGSRPAISIAPAASNPGITLFHDNVAHNLTITPATTWQKGNVNVGDNFASVPAAALFVGDFAPLPGTWSAYYLEAQRKAPYPLAKFGTLESLILDPLTLSDVEIRARFAAVVDQPVSATATSAARPIWGPRGDAVAVWSPFGETQIEDYDGNVVSAWAAAREVSPHTAIIGTHKVRARHTGAATGSTLTNQPINYDHATQGRKTALFTSSTLSTLIYPRSQFLDNEFGLWSTTTLAPGTHGKASFVAIFQQGRAAVSNGFFWGDNSTSNTKFFSIETLTTRALRIRVYGTDGTASYVGGSSSPAIGVGVTVGVFISFDSTDAGIAAGGAATGLTDPNRNRIHIMNMADGSSIHSASYTPVVGALIGSTGTAFIPRVNSGAASTSRAWPIVELIAQAHGVSLDLSEANIPTLRNKVSPSKFGVRHQGRGFFDGVSAYILLTGKASEWNDGAMQLGTAPGTMNITGALDDVNAVAVWPPAELLVPTIVTQPPVSAGSDVLLSIARPVYGGATNVTLTPSLDGALDPALLALPEGLSEGEAIFTTAEPGALSFSFANDGGYTNPAATDALTIGEAPLELRAFFKPDWSLGLARLGV